MQGLLVSISLMPIKTDIMRYSACEKNTNRDPLFDSAAANKHIVSCWKFSETHAFAVEVNQLQSINYEQH